MRMKSNAFRLICILLVLSWMTLPQSTSDTKLGLTSAHSNRLVSSEGGVLIEDIPYFWQEINGFCYWTALSMALHKVGVPIDLHTFFAVSGIGFSNAYVRVNDTMMMLPGAFFRQQAQLIPFCELYDLTHELHVDLNSNWTPLAIEYWSSWGVNITGMNGQSDAFGLLKSTIDEGFPAILWTDPYYLPAEDYDIARDLGIKQNTSAPEVGHAVLAVGYDESDSTVQLMDPGVGSFGPNFGYPDDGRGCYTIDYSALNNAWKALGYGVTILKPGNGSVKDFESTLGEHVVSRLLGNSTSYVPETEELSSVSFGEDSFRRLRLDMEAESIKSYIEQFENMEERVYALLMIGVNLEKMMTLQYLSYRVALEALPDVMPNTDLTQFLVEGRAALSHMEALSENGTLTDLHYLESCDSLLTNTFIGIAMKYNSTEDIDTTLNSYAWQLGKIALSLVRIADAWKAAGEALQAALSGVLEPSASDWSNLIGTAATIGAGAAVILIVLTWKRMKKS
ncbi:MAG: C39 family peptidase [Candidatus Thorarchaeota archaeon]